MLQINETSKDSFYDGSETSEDRVHAQVWELLGTMYAQKELMEKRKEHRYPFPQIIHLTPVSDDGCTPLGNSIVVVGKHLSKHGIGFYHPKPLPYRRMIASFECHGRWLAFIIDLRWCHFTQHGWYESGGRLLQAAPSPMEGQDLANEENGIVPNVNRINRMQ